MRVAKAPRIPSDLVENHIGDLMAGEPQAGAVRADLVAEQPLVIQHIVELEVDVVAIRSPAAVMSPTTT